MASLARARPDSFEHELSAVVERIVQTTAAEEGVLYDLAKEASEPRLLGHWARGDALESTFELEQCPALLRRLLDGNVISIEESTGVAPGGDEAGEVAAQGVQSLFAVPVDMGDRVLALTLSTRTQRCQWGAPVRDGAAFAVEIVAAALKARDANRELERARGDLARVTQRLDSQVKVFKDEVSTVHDFDDIVGNSPAFQTALAALREVAPTDTTALLLGATGTGKELFARALHERSTRRHRPFVCVNCAALPASLIESELFGHERGAFTGAITARQGRFELADRGTIFLDEVGDLPLELQAKLLRVLQEREFERVGSSTPRRVDVRVVAATHHDLQAAANQGRFRTDLFYRLSVYPITLPPLRARVEDIPQLVWFFVNQRQRRLHRRITSVPAAVMQALQRYHWPGNVRELENVIERAMIRSTSGTLHIDESFMNGGQGMPQPDGTGTLEDLERAHIEATLRLCRGRINGAGNAADRLGLHPNTLRFRMKKLGIVRSALAAAS